MQQRQQQHRQSATTTTTTQKKNVTTRTKTTQKKYNNNENNTDNNQTPDQDEPSPSVRPYVFLGPRKSRAKNFSRHPGGESTSSNYEYLDQSYSRAHVVRAGPFTCSGSVSSRPIRARRGPLRRALYIRTNHRGPTVI